MESGSDVPYAVYVPVGPQPLEVERLKDLVESIAAFEPHRSTVVMVDDHPEPRGLERIVSAPAAMRLVSLPLHRPVRQRFNSKGVAGAVMTALAWIQKNADADFAMKLDTDSLVIGPFRQRISEKLRADSALAMIGAYSRTPEGTVRDWSVHRRPIRDMTELLPLRRPWRFLANRADPARRHIRGLYARARAQGYRDGEHCLGGGYALSRAFLDRMAAAGYLDDPQLWISIDLAEEIPVGMHVRALGMRFADFVDPGDVFGVRYRGLPYPPEELASRGYAVIHAVKNDPAHGEAEIRAYFRAKRQAAGAARVS